MSWHDCYSASTKSIHVVAVWNIERRRASASCLLPSLCNRHRARSDTGGRKRRRGPVPDDGAQDMTESYEGSCHCGAIGWTYRTELDPSRWPVRSCQCSFCRRHATRCTSDPAGSAEFSIADAEALHRYRFGLQTAEFLMCRRCGVYIGAWADGPGGPLRDPQPERADDACRRPAGPGADALRLRKPRGDAFCAASSGGRRSRSRHDPAAPQLHRSVLR